MMYFVFKRFLISIFVVIATSALTFCLLSASPGDTAEVIVKRILVGDIEYAPEQQEITSVRQVLGLDQPVIVLYVNWLWKALHGDFGRSYVSGLPVFDEILIRMPATALLALSASLISVAIGIPLGILSASRRNTPVDYALLAYSSFFLAMPNFWFALVLILIFSLKLGILPVSGFGFPNLILPSITLAMSMSAVTLRLTRTSILEVLTQDYIITARSKGLKEQQILYGHALRNALIPVVTIVGIQLGHLLSGTVIIETIFAWPGIGKLLADSIEARDIPMIQGCVVFIAALFSLVNFLVDVIYAVLDPRVRDGEHYV